MKELVRKVAYYSLNSLRPNRSFCGILIYHRVSKLKFDPEQLAVTPKKFEEQLRYLKTHYTILSLDQLTHHLNNKTLPKRSIVITFDDGYADNLLYAKPILEKLHIPATIFVTSEALSGDHEFWWDEIERIFFETKNLPSILKLSIEGKQYDWQTIYPSHKQKAYREIHGILKYSQSNTREETLKRLFSWGNVTRNIRPEYRPLNKEELLKTKSELITIGAHTANHVALSTLLPESQFKEIRQSKEQLETILGQPVNHFSYPFGSIVDFTKTTEEIVSQAGFTTGIANLQGPVHHGSKKFCLPRILVRNWDTNLLETELDRHFNPPTIFHAISNLLPPAPNSCLHAKKVYRNKLLPLLADTTSIPAKNTQNLRSVVQINTIDSKGGAAIVAYRLHQTLKEKFSSTLIVDRALTDDNDVYLLQHQHSSHQKQLINFQERAGWQDFFYLSSLEIPQLPLFQQCDVVHLHNIHSYYFSPFVLARISQLKPTIWTLHDMHALTGHCAHSFECNQWQHGCGKCPHLSTYQPLRRDTSTFLWKEKQKIYQRCQFTVVVPSLWLKEKVTQSILKNQDVRLIPNGVNEKVFTNMPKSEIRKELSLPTNKKILLFSAHGGKQNTWKGGQHLFDLYQKLKARDDILFINIGEDSPSESPKNWINIGYIDNEQLIAKYYAASDILIYPSLADNCPLVVLEAMACGTPVVTFKTGGIPELVEHEHSGLVVDQGNSAALLKATTAILNDKHKQETMAINARNRIVKRFTLDQMAKQYTDLYQEKINKF